MITDYWLGNRNKAIFYTLISLEFRVRVVLVELNLNLRLHVKSWCYIKCPRLPRRHTCTVTWWKLICTCILSFYYWVLVLIIDLRRYVVATIPWLCIRMSSNYLTEYMEDHGCGMPGPGGPDTHKVFGRNFTMGGGTHKVLAEKVSGYGNFRWFTYTNVRVYPCKMLIFWYT